MSVGVGTVLAATAALVVAGSAASAAGPGAVKLGVVGASQSQILSDGAVTVRVRVHRRGRVRLLARVLSQEANAGAGEPQISEALRARFKQPGNRLIRLPLTDGGRTLISRCSRQELIVSAKLKGTHPRALKRTWKRWGEVELNRDGSSCRAPSGTGSGSGSGGGGGGGGGGGTPSGTSPGPSISNADRCDWLDPASCLYPWPNDFFTRNDPSTPTGKRLNLNVLSMPTNRFGVPILPNDYNAADGFSPGNMVITKVPGLDNQQAFANSGLVPITDMARYADPNQGAVVINADTGVRQPIWAELDSNPTNPADRTLIIRPARNFDERGHYIVALRNLKDGSGNAIQPSLGFRVYRDNLITPQAPIEARRPHMEDLFTKLAAAGIPRSNLNLAWDFTVASRQSLTERARSIRDDAFAKLGEPPANLPSMVVQGSSPTFKVTSNTANPSANIAREVKGQFTVPCYLNLPGCPPGSTFLLGSNGLPTQIPGNTIAANFQCEIPQSAVAGGTAHPARVSLYGHGLLGSASEVAAGNVEAMANEHNIIFCATDWVGFSTEDVPSVLLILQDLNNFPKLVDRTQQGFVNFMYLGRAMIHPQGLSSDPAFQVGGQSVIDTNHLYYDGNSQGGILGGALTALAPDFNRAVLGVPAMNYSTLLARSTDFKPYAMGQFSPTICGLLPSPLNNICNMLPSNSGLGLYDNYPNQLERPLIFSLLQLLWDRGEPDGYAHHMTTDPLPNTPPHEVLMQPAFGDHQVANVAAEVEARTIGAAAYKPPFFAGRSPDVTPLVGIPAIPSFPYAGSAIVYYDGGPPGPINPGGTTPPPTTDTAPVNGPPPGGNGSDPHSYPRSDIKARAQKSAFLMPNGVVQNYCLVQNNLLTNPVLLTLTGTPSPCYSHGFTGP